MRKKEKFTRDITKDKTENEKGKVYGLEPHHPQPQISLVLGDAASEVESVAVLRDDVLDDAQISQLGDGHVSESRLRLRDVDGQLQRLLCTGVGTFPSSCGSKRMR